MNDKGNVTIDTGECKGCGLCVEACVPKVLQLSEGLNPYGYHAASYAGHGCTGCGPCAATRAAATTASINFISLPSPASRGR